MGIVKKQSIQYSFIYYLGVILGYINTVLLFPNILEADQFGLTRILLSVAIIIAQLAQLGSTSMVIRYHAVLKEKVFSIGLLACTSGLILLLSLMYVLKTPITNLYIENSSLFVDYYLLLIPFSIAIVYFNLFDAYLRTLYKNGVTAFLSNILLRLIWLVLILLFSFSYISFDQFILLYSCSYALISLISFFYIQITHKTRISFSFSKDDKSFFKQIGSFNFFTLLAGLSTFLINKVDIIMLGSMEGLEVLGIYAIAAYMGIVIRVPASSIGRTAQVIVVNAFKHNDLKSISNLYQKTAITQMILAGAVFILILVNFHNITYLLPEEYAGSFQIFIFLGFAQVLDSSMGINGFIMINSKYYRMETLSSGLLLGITLLSNYIFIPIFGGLGAALATLLSIFIYNLFRMVYILYKLKMQPYTYKSIIALIICLLAFAGSYYFPYMINFVVDAILRSMVFALIFVPLVYFAKLSLEINQIIDTLLIKVRSFIT